MITIPLSDYGGKDFEVHEFNEMPLRVWELVCKIALEDNYTFLDFIKEAYGIPKNKMRLFPRVVLDLIEDQYAKWMEQADIVDIKQTDVLVQNLPYHKWLDLEAKLKECGGNPALFIKYMLVIVLEDYEVDNLEKKARAKLKTNAMEGISYLLFFCMNDPKFTTLINQFIPLMGGLQMPLQQQMEQNLKNAMEIT